MKLTEYEVKLMAWSIQTSMNALAAETQQDDPAVTDEAAALLIRGLNKLEERLTNYYEEEILEDASESE